jgi:hypothetical protein
MTVKISKQTILVAAIGVAVGVNGDRLLMRDPVAVYAQQQRNPPVLVIGSESVSVGMPRDAVIARFAGKYELLPFSGSKEDLSHPTGTVIIAQKDDTIGVVTFKDGKLINAEREWATFFSAGGIDKLWVALDGALSQQLELNKWLTVQIRSAQLEVPEMGGKDDRHTFSRKNNSASEGPLGRRFRRSARSSRGDLLRFRNNAISVVLNIELT